MRESRETSQKLEWETDVVFLFDDTIANLRYSLTNTYLKLKVFQH